MSSSESTTPTPSSNAAALSRRALKRLAKEQKQKQEQPEDNKVKVELPPTRKNHEKKDQFIVSSINKLTITPPDHDQFVEHIQKRLRNLQKRKQKLDKYQEMDPTQLNEDQLTAIRNKQSVETPLKDLNELLEQYQIQLTENENRFKQLQQEINQDFKKLLDQQISQEQAKATEKLSLTIKFLRAASFKRQLVNDIPVEESSGLEQLLHVIYGGDDEALERLDLLYKASE